MSILTREEIAAIAGDDESIYSGLVDFGFAVEEAVIRKLATVSVEPVVNVSNDGWIIVTGTGLAPGAKLVPVEALAAARAQALEEAAKRIEGPNNNYGAVIRALIGCKDD